jgi:hypothetical protein
MGFPVTFYVVQNGTNVADMATLETLDGVQEGTEVALCRVIKSGPLVRKTETKIGQPPRKARADKGKPRAKTPSSGAGQGSGKHEADQTPAPTHHCTAEGCGWKGQEPTETRKAGKETYHVCPSCGGIEVELIA